MDRSANDQRTATRNRSRTPTALAAVLVAAACGGSGTSTLSSDGGAGAAGSGGSAAGSGGSAGASATGGTAGSAATGGSSANGGTGGSSGNGGTGGTNGVCETDADCFLHNDCCTCEAVHVGANPSYCDAACELEACNGLGVIATRCEDGQCVPLSNCRELPSPTMCDPTPPPCPAGQRPVNGNFGGQCFTGECVDASDCTQVPGCDACEPGSYCVEDVVVSGVAGGANEVRYRCRPAPSGCSGSVDCDCARACSGDCTELAEGIRCTDYAP